MIFIFFKDDSWLYCLRIENIFLKFKKFNLNNFLWKKKLPFIIFIFNKKHLLLRD